MRTASVSRSIVLYIVILGLTAGCGTNKVYRISSDPPGAKVWSGNVVYGTTPFTTDLNAVLPHSALDYRPPAPEAIEINPPGFFPLHLAAAQGLTQGAVQ